MSVDRRQFLKLGLSSLAYFTLEATTPNWIIRSANAFAGQGLPDGRILVILQMGGGNDGLNMVIPRTDPIYYDAAIRPTIHIPAGMELNLDGLNGFHPRMPNLASWYQKGVVSIVNNVGYNNPNLSHFTSTDYWTLGAVPGEVLPKQGWVSRFFDNACAGLPSIDRLAEVVAGSTSIPEALSGSTLYVPPAIDQPTSYALTTNTDRALRLAAINSLNNQTTSDIETDYVQRSVNLAEASISDIATAAATPVLVDQYSTDSFGRGLKLTSQIIRAGFKTSVFYVVQGGYDTHAGQVSDVGDVTNGTHPKLLGALDQNLNAFLSEMEQSGNLSRVLLMTFSEFGRRVAENGSKGTDHGTASCMLLAGGGLAGGTFGGQPNLAALLKGNLNYQIDFRSVYAKIMEGWLNQSSIPVFGQSTYQSVLQPQMARLQFLTERNAARPAWLRYN